MRSRNLGGRMQSLGGWLYELGLESSRENE